MNNPLGRVLRQTLLKLGGQAAPQEDADLLERFVTTRDEAAFEQIVRRHGPMVWRVGQRVLRQTQDVEDVFQATFVVLARKAGVIARPELLGGWLHGVAHRVSLEARTQRARREARQQSLTNESAIPDQSEAPHDGDWRTILDAEIARLPEKYRLPLVLCDLEGLTCEEAARRLGIPTGTIKKRRFQVRELLRERLARRGVTCSVASLATVLAQEAAAAMPAAVAALAGQPGAAHGGSAAGSAALDLAWIPTGG